MESISKRVNGPYEATGDLRITNKGSVVTSINSKNKQYYNHGLWMSGEDATLCWEGGTVSLSNASTVLEQDAYVAAISFGRPESADKPETATALEKILGEFNDGVIQFGDSAVKLSVSNYIWNACGIVGRELKFAAGASGAINGTISVDTVTLRYAAGIFAVGLEVEGKLNLEFKINSIGESSAYAISARQYPVEVPVDPENPCSCKDEGGSEDDCDCCACGEGDGDGDGGEEGAGCGCQEPVECTCNEGICDEDGCECGCQEPADCSCCECEEWTVTTEYRGSGKIVLLNGTDAKFKMTVKVEGIPDTGSYTGAYAWGMYADQGIEIGGVLYGNHTITAIAGGNCYTGFAQAYGFHSKQGDIVVGDLGAGFGLTVTAKGAGDRGDYGGQASDTVAAGFLAQDGSLAMGTMLAGSTWKVTGTGGRLTTWSFLPQYFLCSAVSGMLAKNDLSWEGMAGGNFNLTVKSTGGTGKSGENSPSAAMAYGIAADEGVLTIGYDGEDEVIAGNTLAGTFKISAAAGANGADASGTAYGFLGGAGVKIARLADKFSLTVEAKSGGKARAATAHAAGVEGNSFGIGAIGEAVKFQITATAATGSGEAYGVLVESAISIDAVGDKFQLTVKGQGAAAGDLGQAFGFAGFAPPPPEPPDEDEDEEDGEVVDPEPEPEPVPPCSIAIAALGSDFKLTATATGTWDEEHRRQAAGFYAENGVVSIGAIGDKFTLSVTANAKKGSAAAAHAVGIEGSAFTSDSIGLAAKFQISASGNAGALAYGILGYEEIDLGTIGDKANFTVKATAANAGAAAVAFGFASFAQPVPEPEPEDTEPCSCGEDECECDPCECDDEVVVPEPEPPLPGSIKIAALGANFKLTVSATGAIDAENGRQAAGFYAENGTIDLGAVGDKFNLTVSANANKGTVPQAHAAGIYGASFTTASIGISSTWKITATGKGGAQAYGVLTGDFQRLDAIGDKFTMTATAKSTAAAAAGFAYGFANFAAADPAVANGVQIDAIGMNFKLTVTATGAMDRANQRQAAAFYSEANGIVIGAIGEKFTIAVTANAVKGDLAAAHAAGFQSDGGALKIDAGAAGGKLTVTAKGNSAAVGAADAQAYGFLARNDGGLTHQLQFGGALTVSATGGTAAGMDTLATAFSAAFRLMEGDAEITIGPAAKLTVTATPGKAGKGSNAVVYARAFGIDVGGTLADSALGGTAVVTAKGAGGAAWALSAGALADTVLSGLYTAAAADGEAYGIAAGGMSGVVVSGALVANSKFSAAAIYGEAGSFSFAISGAVYAGQNGNAAALLKLAGSDKSAAAQAKAHDGRYRAIELTGDVIDVRIEQSAVVIGDLVFTQADGDSTQKLTIESGAQLYGNLSFLDADGNAYDGAELHFSIVAPGLAKPNPLLTVRDGIEGFMNCNLTVSVAAAAFATEADRYILIRGLAEFSAEFISNINFADCAEGYDETLNGWVVGDYLYSLTSVASGKNSYDLVLTRALYSDESGSPLLGAYATGPELGGLAAGTDGAGLSGVSALSGYRPDDILNHAWIA